MVNMETLRILAVISDCVKQTESVPQKNSCDGVLDNLTLKLTLLFVETSAAIIVLLLLLLVLYYFTHIY
jgi:hypothetical protein